VELTNENKKSRIGRILALAGFVLIISAGVLLYFGWKYLKKPNIDIHGEQITYLYIPTGASYEAVKDSLRRYLIDESTFVWVASKKNYPDLIKPGRYRLRQGMDNNLLINTLRSGLQEPVKLSFTHARTRNDLSKKLSQKLEVTKSKLDSLLNNNQYLEKFGFDTTTITGMFIPNTYEVYWNISADALFNKLNTEYQKFWSPVRIQKADKLNMSPKEVSTLASIVQSETNKNDEKPRIAGVYINRLERGMPLEADPTIVYALGNFSKQRVLNVDKMVESPYNTYKYGGLPPGPICVPDVSSLDAVLNYEKHNYLYFCAKEDFSGYSNFATTYQEHVKNARKYQAELTRRKIMK
jgi:UPF0755 protein